MTWVNYLKIGILKLVDTPLVIDDSELILNRFNSLFKDELKREANTGLGHGNNPYDGIGNIYVSLNSDRKSFLVEDIYKYLPVFYSGIYEEIDGKMLCLNIKEQGLNKNYFEYRNKETKEWISIKSIVNGNAPINTNVQRMINILFNRQLPFFAKYRSKDILFIDYSDKERKEILEELFKTVI